jgi:hypothetical protein
MRRREQVRGREWHSGRTTQATTLRCGPGAKRRSQRLIVSVALCSFLLVMAIVVIRQPPDHAGLASRNPRIDARP